MKRLWDKYRKYVSLNLNYSDKSNKSPIGAINNSMEEKNTQQLLEPLFCKGLLWNAKMYFTCKIYMKILLLDSKRYL